MDDILLNKAAIIERCLRRVAEEQAACPELDNYTHIDAIILNLEKACQAAIDIAMHFIACEHLGIPQSSADAFSILFQSNKITKELAGKLKAMVGFRNIAVHEYEGLNFGVVKFILDEGKYDLVEFCSQLGVKIQLHKPSQAQLVINR